MAIEPGDGGPLFFQTRGTALEPSHLRLTARAWFEITRQSSSSVPEKVNGDMNAVNVISWANVVSPRGMFTPHDDVPPLGCPEAPFLDGGEGH